MTLRKHSFFETLLQEKNSTVQGHIILQKRLQLQAKVNDLKHLQCVLQTDASCIIMATTKRKFAKQILNNTPFIAYSVSIYNINTVLLC